MHFHLLVSVNVKSMFIDLKDKIVEHKLVPEK